MSNHNEISSFIWDVCDDVLRNKFEENEYGSVILPFTVLRRLDCLLESQKDDVIGIYNETTESGIEDPSPIIFRKTGFKFYNHSKYDLVRLKSDPNNLKLNINNYLNGFSENVFEILKYYEIEKIIEKLQRNKILYSLIDKFSEVNLHPDVVDNRSMGLIYEELLRRYSEKSNKFSGDHYTPRDIVKLLVSLVFTGEENVLDKEGTIRSIYDPCCGTGGMLTIGKEWVQKNLTDKVKFQLYGQESLELTYSMCKSDFLIINEEPDRIRHGSSLSEDRFEGNLFDYMITNPPLTPSYEFIYHLTKSMDYDYHPTLTILSYKTKPSLPPRYRSVNGEYSISVSPYLPNVNGKNMGDYWNEDIVRTSVTNQKLDIEGEHPAPFSKKIITLPILQTSNEFELVLDPFMGSGTSGKVCDNLERSIVGYD